MCYANVEQHQHVAAQCGSRESRQHHCCSSMHNSIQISMLGCVCRTTPSGPARNCCNCFALARRACSGRLFVADHLRCVTLLCSFSSVGRTSSHESPVLTNQTRRRTEYATYAAICTLSEFLGQPSYWARVAQRSRVRALRSCRTVCLKPGSQSQKHVEHPGAFARPTLQTCCNICRMPTADQ